MKTLVIIVGLITTIAAFAAIGFTEKESEKGSSAGDTGLTNGAAFNPWKPASFGRVNVLNTELTYRVYGKNEHPVTEEKLANATTLADVIPFYPSNWIDEYQSVEISTVLGGEERRATGKNQILSEEQIHILRAADLASEINLDVKYKAKNPVTGEQMDNQMNITMTVIPEKEAEYKGGYDEMIRYLKENSKNGISGISPNLPEPAFIQFTVTEEGKIADVDLKKTSGYPQIDKLMYEIIRDMPDWKPAENSKGEKVKQNFEFALGVTGDGC